MPDSQRLQVFVLMMIMTCAHVMMKVLACSLILRLSRLWLAIYVGVDMFLFTFVKFLRGDLRYWVRLDGLLCWIVTVVARILVKTVADL